MGMQLGDSGEGGAGGVFGRQGMISEINITPFVDVILVLLIIFMVTAPFAVSGVNVQLPQSQAKALKLSGDPIVLSVTPQGQFFLQKIAVADGELVAKIQAAIGSDKEASVYIRADKTVPYGKVMEAMGAAQAAGASRIGMMGESRGPSRK
jgi:biopolymer transport protein TolR